MLTLCYICTCTVPPGCRLSLCPTGLATFAACLPSPNRPRCCHQSLRAVIHHRPMPAHALPICQCPKRPECTLTDRLLRKQPILPALHCGELPMQRRKQLCCCDVGLRISHLALQLRNLCARLLRLSQHLLHAQCTSGMHQLMLLKACTSARSVWSAAPGCLALCGRDWSASMRTGMRHHCTLAAVFCAPSSAA